MMFLSIEHDSSRSGAEDDEDEDEEEEEEEDKPEVSEDKDELETEADAYERAGGMKATEETQSSCPTSSVSRYTHRQPPAMGNTELG